MNNNLPDPSQLKQTTSTSGRDMHNQRAQQSSTIFNCAGLWLPNPGYVLLSNITFFDIC